jgi:transcriptional regulator with XRE-family HTH domain
MTFKETIKKLRDEANLSQQDVADSIGVVRPTYAGLESGRREPTLPELRKLAELHSVTIEQLAQGTMDAPSVQPELEPTPKNVVDEIIPRAVPREQVEKFKNVLLYLLDKVGAKPNVGETVIYKLLYFIDFDYYEKYGKTLIGAQYIKNHFGPTPVSFKKIVEEMQEKEQIDVVSGSFFKYKQRKYMPRIAPDLSELSAQELEHINDVIQKLGDKQANELSELSHKDTPWIATEIGKPISYQLAMYRTPATSVKVFEDEL